MKFLSLIVCSLLLTITQNSIAQKIYNTKAAQVKFFSKTKAENIEAINNQAESKLIAKTGQLMFSLLIKGFRFENELMQEHFNGEDYMNSDKYPKGDFKGTITNIASIKFDKNGNYPATVDGIITIRGISQKVKASGTITVNNTKISCKSDFKIKIKDFGLKGKDIGTIIANELQITVDAKYN